MFVRKIIETLVDNLKRKTMENKLNLPNQLLKMNYDDYVIK